WSAELCDKLGIDLNICPPSIESHAETGNIAKNYALKTGFMESTRIFEGGADKAWPARGSGILEDGKTLCSIATSGVVLSYEDNDDRGFQGKVHYFNHAAPDAFYTMGVTLAAGYSLTWFKETFAPEESFDDLLADIKSVPAG